MVHVSGCPPQGQSGQVPRPTRRFPFSVGSGSRGLHVRQKALLHHGGTFSTAYPAASGYVCQPGKYPVEKFCVKAPTLAGSGGGCSEVPIGRGWPLLCKPPLDPYPAVVVQTAAKPPSEVPHDYSLLGFRHMVAPLGKTALSGDSSHCSPPYGGMFRNCQGQFMPPPRWPLLCTVLSGQHWRADKFRLKTSQLF